MLRRVKSKSVPRSRVALRAVAHPEELQDDDLLQEIFVVEGEMHDVQASQSLKFPNASDVANVGAAVGVLQARVASSAAASAIVAAAGAVVDAWSP